MRVCSTMTKVKVEAMDESTMITILGRLDKGQDSPLKE